MKRVCGLVFSRWPDVCIGHLLASFNLDEQKRHSFVLSAPGGHTCCLDVQLKPRSDTSTLCTERKVTRLLCDYHWHRRNLAAYISMFLKDFVLLASFKDHTGE